ncbi:hypothetical protein ACHAPT_010405 [Fusarium lateritium]
MDWTGLKDRWETARAQDRHIVEELFSRIQAQSRELAEKESIIDQAQREKRETLQKQDAHSYILVLIDGDCMPFVDELVRQGKVGGTKAAQALKDAIKAKWSGQSPYMEVVTCIYANMKGMGNTYKQSEVLSDLSDWYEFVCGFNMVDPLFDYVNAGNGKECADYKIKTVFRHHFDNVHCRRIVLGASADNGYARLLGGYVGDKSSRERITLLKGPSFARELAEIAHQFEVCSFAKVFSSRKVSFSRAPSQEPWRARSRSRSSRPTTPDGGLRSVLKSPQLGSARLGSPVSRILRNKNGERVDAPIDKVPREVFEEVKGWRLCNRFYLLGECGARDKCRHDHTREVKSEHLGVLRSLTRGSPCRNGLACSDENCLAGHCCRYANCTSSCWFPPEMHGVDNRVVAQV